MKVDVIRSPGQRVGYLARILIVHNDHVVTRFPTRDGHTGRQILTLGFERADIAPIGPHICVYREQKVTRFQRLGRFSAYLSLNQTQKRRLMLYVGDINRLLWERGERVHVLGLELPTRLGGRRAPASGGGPELFAVSC